MCPGSPTAEAGDLKSPLGYWCITTCVILCCSFEAHAEYFPARWPESQPIYVHVYGPRNFQKIVKEACDLISDLSHGAITFQKGKGGITVKRGVIYPFWGLTALNVSEGAITSADVMVTRSLRIGRKNERELLRLTVLHELLHALGMAHSDDPQSLLYFEIDGDELSPQDVIDIQHLYGGGL